MHHLLAYSGHGLDHKVSSHGSVPGAQRSSGEVIIMDTPMEDSLERSKLDLFFLY